ncbi:hypothetical protein [Salipiger sp. CCB-MM3]|uniref:hypothetical protein n=1 Tax=Salipiger sp. CCB-MM3 TaxID=1792508 RepID=UPI0012F8C5AE|nr:hypothetical protein [Salipiger sp. CCB-MM3]
MTFESIQTIGEGHQKNAVTKYQNALYRYIEKLREKKVAINAKNRKIQQLLDLVSFIQPTVQQDGSVLTIRVPARNGTDQALASLEVTVSAKTAAESWAEPEPIGATTVQFKDNFLSKESRVLEFSVETEDYTGGQISLDVTELTTEGGFSINEQTMAEPIQVIDELISDAEWKRRMIEDELQSATERYP